MELRGFEPLTPSLRTRCSARLSYSPLRDGNCIQAPTAGQIDALLQQRSSGEGLGGGALEQRWP